MTSTPPPAPLLPLERGQRWATRIALVGILVVAGLLRFYGLSAGLRHVPDPDETVFVESVRTMLRAGDLDHRFYEYPGLFIYLLAPVLALFSTQGPADPSVYLAARAVAAAFSLLSVALVFFLARRLGGASAGLLAAALMAVAPIEIWTMHMLRSDVVLEAFVLGSLLWFQRAGGRMRDDFWSGAAIGATAAIKFTGVLIVPAYVVARCVRPGHRWRALFLAGACSIVVWLAFTPYALIRPSAYLAGASNQTAYFYAQPGFAPHFLAYVDFYLREIARGVGFATAGAALLGFFAARRAWRTWLPLVVYPLALIAVLATAEARLSRLALSCVGGFVAMAGVGLAAALRRSRLLGGALAALVVALPLWHGIEASRQSGRPSTMDQALDWIAQHVPAGGRILCAVPRFGLDPQRYEILSADRLVEADRTWVKGMEWIVLAGKAPANWQDEMVSRAVFVPEPRVGGQRIEVFEVRPVVWQPVTVAPGWVKAAVSREQLPALIDGDVRSAWRTPGPQAAGTWIEIDFPRSQRLDRIELLPASPREFARALDIFVVGQDGQEVSPVTYAGRPHPRDVPRERQPASQVSLMKLDGILKLRLVLRRDGQQPWSISELRLATAAARESQAAAP